MISFRCNKANTEQTLTFSLLRHQRHIATTLIMLGCLEQRPRSDTVSVLHMTALDTVAFTVDEQRLEEDISRFPDKDDQKQKPPAPRHCVKG